MKARYGFKIICSVLAVIFIFSFTGCGNSKQNTSGKVEDKNAKISLKVGYFPNLTHAQALVGFSDGTFQRALGKNVNIEEHIFNAGPAEIEALLAGEIDLGYIGPVPAINGFVKSGGKLRIIAGAADAGAVLVARQGAKIEKVEDLDGKKVAVPQLGNTQDISLRNLLNQANLKDASKGGTVTVIPAENPDILTLIAKGEVDAALVPEPWGSRIVKQAGGKIVLDANDVWRKGKYATAVVIASTKFMNEHPELVEKWLAAHVEITQRINSDKERCKSVINSQIEKLTKKSLPDDVLASSLKRIVVTYDPESESVKDFVNLSVENGYLKDNPDITNLFEIGTLNKVLKMKGLQALQ